MASNIQPEGSPVLEDRIRAVSTFVQEHLNQMAHKFPGEMHNPIYRWEHTCRVANYGKLLAEAEGADVEIVVAACLLHDVAHFESDDDYKDHGRRGADIARSLLEGLGYAPEKVENICFSVASHVDGEAGFDHPMTIEAKCVTDADNLDRFGAYRILQWCVPEMDELPKLIGKLTKRIETLRRYRQTEKLLETNTGDRIFKRQLDRQINFFQALIAEYELTQVPFT
jgi:uncharacterized protein